MAETPIYLDYNATTPTDPRVADTMEPYLRDHFGNPSSGHIWGQRSREGVDRARAQVAALLQAKPEQVIFTSGGTEANNHAIVGAARLAQKRRPGTGHIVTSAVEHPAISAVCDHLLTQGLETTAVGVDSTGRVDPAAVAAALRPDTFLVTVMLANNEVGTLQPIREIADLAREKGILSHSDCAQAVSKVPVGLVDLGVDMISLAGHKVYGPKGVGALVLRPGVAVDNLMFGANHESGRRPGTENVLEIVGLGQACALIGEDLAHEMVHLAGLRDQLQELLLAGHPTARVNGHATERLPNTLSISFPGRVAGEILAHLPDVAVSAGAACHSEGVHISHVLTAMGVPVNYALGTLRLSVGRMTQPGDITEGAARLIRAVHAAPDHS
ncbi:MAG: aminotransferase class V-fold PLP-dependent enzyme [Candidatus Krumholzibacteria bacterium]|nr:aminotransferase class V-fold PLP-dependent enzyme [Candidatus Krumholzibacteria bacterium]